MPRIKVPLKDRSYAVDVGHASGAKLRATVAAHMGEGRLFLFMDAGFFALHGAVIRKQLQLPAKRIREFVVPSGERFKSAATVAGLHAYLLSEGISRNDLILACGGGVHSDLVGYAAATVLRGVRWGVVPTTLLGMVDASIGGKTGVNHPLGKNLIGAIWQPTFVHIDLAWLATLPPREFFAGMGEIVKYAGLQGGPTLQAVHRIAPDPGKVSTRQLSALVAASVRYKASIIADDERESGRRMLLNLGHTFAHGIEHALGYGRLLHGEAVLLGLLAMWHASVEQGARPGGAMAQYRSIIEQFVRHIPYRRLDPGRVVEAMATDKKRLGGTVRFVLLSRPGQPFIDSSVTAAAARRALAAALVTYREHGGRNAANSGR